MFSFGIEPSVRLDVGACVDPLGADRSGYLLCRATKPIRRRSMMSRWLGASVLALSVALGAGNAHAIPELQIYIDGAMYDTNTETWVTTQPDFDLWIVGDVD